MSKAKQQTKKIIEYLGLGKMADFTRFQLEKSRNQEKNQQFLKDHPDLVLPSPFMVYETFNLDYEKYYRTGREDAEWIKEEVKDYLSFENNQILDWGCGPGRVIRHFPEIVNSTNQIWGCDYNQEYVDWCSNNLKGIRFFTNQLNPPMALEAAQMDLIYGLSIFTHLSEESHFRWIEEMHRVLKSGGILFITSHGDITRKNLLESEINDYDDGKLVVRGNIKEGYRMYCAYHPIPFMKKLFDGKFVVMKHRPGKEQSWGLQQDLWVLKNK